MEGLQMRESEKNREKMVYCAVIGTKWERFRVQSRVYSITWAQSCGPFPITHHLQ